MYKEAQGRIDYVGSPKDKSKSLREALKEAGANATGVSSEKREEPVVLESSEQKETRNKYEEIEAQREAIRNYREERLQARKRFVRAEAPPPGRAEAEPEVVEGEYREVPSGKEGEKESEHQETNKERIFRLAREATTLVAAGIGLGEVLEMMGLDPDSAKAVAKVVKIAEEAKNKKQAGAEEPEQKNQPIPEEKEKQKEKSGEEWEKIQTRMGQLADKELKGEKMLPSEMAEKEKLKKVREKMWEEFKGPEDDPIGQRHYPWKDQAAGEIDGLIKEDEEAEKNRKMMPDANFDRDNPLNKMMGSLDTRIDFLRNLDKGGGKPRTEEEAMQLSWLQGVKRNIEESALQAELALYQKLKLTGDPAWRGRIDEISARLRVLGVETEYLNIGKGVREATIHRMSDLSSRYVKYLEDNGPRAAELQKAEKEAAQPPREEGRTKEKNGYEEVVSMLTTALIEGSWMGKGLRSAQNIVEAWIEANGADKRVSWVKALHATVDWINKADQGDNTIEVTKNVLRLPYGSETLEALESNKELLTAKMAVLETTGFNFNAEVVDKETRRRRIITDKDIRENNYPVNFTDYLNKEKKLVERIKFDGTREDISFWRLGVNEYKQALEVMAEDVRKALETSDPAKKFEDGEVMLLAITAIRQIQNSGFWNMYHTEYSAHPYIKAELTAAMFPGDALLSKIDGNDKSLMLDKGQRPGHYRLITGARELFARRHYKTGMYDPEDFKPVEGYPGGMNWNRLVLAPERMKSYLIEPKVFAAGNTTLLGRWMSGVATENREEFFKQGPMKIPSFQRAAALSIFEKQWQPVTLEGVNKSRRDFLKEMGGKLGLIMKDYGFLTGNANQIKEKLLYEGNDRDKIEECQKNREIIRDVARFLFTRGEIFMIPEKGTKTLGKLDRWDFETTTMVIAMEGWKVGNPGKMRHKGPTITGKEEWRFSPELVKEGWWVDVGEDVEEAGGAVERTRINLEDPDLMEWLKQAGLPYPDDAVGRVKTKLVKWLKNDPLACALLHVKSLGLDDPFIPEWGGMNIQEAFMHGSSGLYRASATGRNYNRVVVGGLGSHGEKVEKWNDLDVIKKTAEERFLV